MLIWFELCYLFVTQFLIILEKTNKYKNVVEAIKSFG